MAQLIEFAGNHLLLTSAFFFLFTMLIMNVLQGGGSKAVLPIEAVQLLNRQDAVPLDIRSVADFESGHIINARNIPMAELKSRADELKKLKSRPLLVYCASGTTSAAALRELSSAGFEHVSTLKGGIAAWRSENLPLT